MAQALQITFPSGGQELIPLGGDVLRIDAKAGASYRLVDELDPSLQQDAIIRRIGDDLLIDMLAGTGDVLLVDYFFICELDFRGCAIELETIGGAPGELLTPGNDTETLLSDGSALIWTSPPAPGSVGIASNDAAAATTLSSAGTDADSGFVFSWPVAGAVLGGVALVAAAAGGGGGGGGSDAVDSDSGGSGPLAARKVSITTAASDAAAPVGADGEPATGPGVVIEAGELASGAQTNDTSPALSGALDQVLVEGERLEVYRNGQVVGEADTDGLAWSFTDTDVPAGEQIYTVRLADADGNRSPASNTYTLQVDGTAPDAPVIDPVTGDNVISAVELAAGVAVSGSAEAGAVVTATWGDETVTGNALDDGRFELRFAAGELPDGSLDNMTLTATDSFGNIGASSSQPVTLGFTPDTEAPGRPTISGVDSSRNYVNNSTAADGVQVWGKAEAGSRVEATWGEVTVAGQADDKGAYQLTFDRVPVANGRSTISVVSIDAAGNVSDDRSETVTVVISDRYRLASIADNTVDGQSADAEPATLVLKAGDLLETPQAEALFPEAADLPADAASDGLAAANSEASGLGGTLLFNLTLQSAENPLM